MSETFKIRKNKSQKQIHLNHQLRRRSPLLTTQQMPKTKVTAYTHFQKIIQLEPLVKSKVSAYQEGGKTQNFKLDNTQPIPHLTPGLNKQEIGSEGLHLEKIDTKGSQKTDHSEKENRPNSVNEVKYPSISKISSTYIKTEQVDYKPSLTQMTQGIQYFRSQKDPGNDESKKLFPEPKKSKMALLKTSSRSKLAKIFNKQGSLQRQEVKTETQSEVSQKTFRKGILNKIFSQTRNATPNNPSPKEASIIQEKEEEASTKDQQALSPLAKKDPNSNWGNCSTIRQQEESCSSFISKSTFQELVRPKQIFECLPFPEEKGHYQKRIKVQEQRIKKKFPENFFK